MIETLLLLGLAAHRAWYLWLNAELCRPLRAGLVRLGERLSRWRLFDLQVPNEEGLQHVPGGRLGYLVSCGDCTAVWVGLITFATWAYGGPVGLALIWGLAVTGALASVNLALRIGETVAMLSVRTREQEIYEQAKNGHAEARAAVERHVQAQLRGRG